MTPDPEVETRSAVRCATSTRASQIDPIGTATPSAGFLLLAHPLPWPRDVKEIAGIEPVLQAASAAGLRVQVVAPSRASGAILHRRAAPDDGWFRGYQRVESGDTDDPAGAALRLLADSSPPSAAPVTDVLVCTHGKRDLCCGSQGTPVAMDLLASPPPGAVAHRTSHLGGHRFAPTALVLPQGTLWSGLDAAALRRVVARQGLLDDLLPHYRGSTGIGSPSAQAIERVAFATVGWGWLDHRRRSRDRDDGTARIDAIAPDGTATAWEGRTTGQEYAVPACGVEGATAEVHTQLIVEWAEQVA